MLAITRSELAEKGYTEEQIDEIDKIVFLPMIKRNNYKVLTGRKVTIYKQVFGNMTFYKIMIMKKKKDEEEPIKAYKQVYFIGCKPPEEDKTDIIINDLYEDFYFKKDDKYNPIFTIGIKDYFVLTGDYGEEKQAISSLNVAKYNANNENNDFVLEEEWDNFDEFDNDNLPF